MTPGKQDLIIYQGSTFRRKIYLDANGTPVDLTGCIARMHIRELVDDEIPVITLDHTNDRALVTDAANGEITLYIADEDTELLTFIKGGYDLEVEFANGDVERVLMGKIKLSREYTREPI